MRGMASASPARLTGLALEAPVDGGLGRGAHGSAVHPSYVSSSGLRASGVERSMVGMCVCGWGWWLLLSSSDISESGLVGQWSVGAMSVEVVSSEDREVVVPLSVP